ncbi:PREDICTED: ATP-binding cassette sub-family A member 1-like [Dufourea novaeangliae]|uniref:ATP-binding cassette sub-family A member 3 n=1 Tax=Dufourea novaeangliae TaxID=178035 RepID=A0A154PP38_DUFNO|nr:PREDICTED: ATP-binding cassette sub-family A member 1-like [Dufourea novaeangliae]KZC13655.1 ATP-binding cassette sub-family A member 3 [Dufourea novaeangliae]
MRERIRIFNLLLYKNLLVRVRHWKTALFLQCLVPIALFVLIQAVRDFSVQPPRVINNSTYYSLETKEELTKVNTDFTFLYYVPRNEYIAHIVEDIRMCLSLPSEKVAGFLSEDEMIETYTVLEATFPTTNLVALVFEQYNTSSIRYKVRHAFKIPNILFQNVLDQSSYNTHSLYFNAIPFVQLQTCVDESLINLTALHSTPGVKVSIQRMPYPPYVKIDESDIILRLVICMFAVIAFLIPLCIETNHATKEKYIGVNVLMSMNGVKQYMNLLSWLTTGILFSIFYIVPIIVLFKNTFSGNVDPYLYYSNTFIFWLILTVHVAHLISFGMHVSAYFSKPRFVIITLSIVYTASFSLHGNLVRNQVFSVIPYLGIVFPNILLYRFLEEVNAYEAQLTGIQWSNMFFVGDAQYNTVGCIGFILIFSLLGLLLHFTLAVYVNALLPGKYGIRKEPLYFFKYFKKNKVNLDTVIDDFDYDKIDNENFEPVKRGVLIPGVQIRNLKKTYRTGFLRKTTVQAVKGISMDLYKGQITALLGHNGAGKTTLMSIITGVISSTEGDVFVNGKNIKTHLEFIRSNLGLCPQENMVFPDLNVIEQLEFFGLLKGSHKTRKEIKEDVMMLLDKLNLIEKRNALPNTLSGGQKRRLCLGMALVGDANIIILDEPTSGMDPETRRDIWDIILKIRGKKTILISTHNMEEADILGDRIAIVHGGKLKCYGTSLFLKKQYGYGHIAVTLSTKSWCNPDKVIGKFDRRTQQVSVDSEKIVLSVPNTTNLPESLDSVENQKQDLGVTGISVSLITLEEVYLKVIKKEDNGKHLNEVFCPPSQRVDGWTLYTQTILALYHKKLTYTVKNLSNTLFTLFFPILSVVLMGLSYDSPRETTNVFPIELDMYRSPKALYSYQSNTLGIHYKNVVEHFGGSSTEVTRNQSVTQALLDHAVENIAEYRNRYIVSAEFNISDEVLYANGFYSGIAIHSIPITMNLLSNVLIKSFAGEEYSIHVSSQQLPSSLSSTQLYMPETESLSRVMVFCCIFFPTVALFVVHPFQETETKMKQLQRMTGVTSTSYWITMFTFDFIVLTASVLIITLGFYVMDVILDIRLYYKTEILVMILTLLLFGVNSLLITYIFSFSNKSRNGIVTMLSLAPIGLVLLQYLFHEVIHSFDSLKVLHIIQKRLFRLIPHVSLFHGHLSFYNVSIQNARCRRLPSRLLDVVCLGVKDICCGLECDNGNCKNQLSYFSNGDTDMSLTECVVYLAITPLIYFSLLIIIEEGVFDKLRVKIFGKHLRNPLDVNDGQVEKEKHAVASEIRKRRNCGIATGEGNIEPIPTIDMSYLESSETHNDSLFLVYELSKYYGKLMAVREINFRVRQRECFGLLGVNGAGKSTTFRMLTGEEVPNSGTMYLGKSDINTDRKNYLAQMGYCPQTDALLGSLNSFDHLRLFALLRGIPKSKVDLEVNKWINRLNLNACMSQPSSTYSGGNKRRLNIAMALIGNPTLVLLDEPTTGVDPAARRSLWNILQSCQAMGQAIILTSHSMEECEALCNRLVIMVKGQLVCIGASQELKQRFGAGYDIDIKLNPSRSDDDLCTIKNTIESSLACEIRDENLGFIAYHVSDSGTTWEKMYNTMNNLRTRFSCIEDYAVLSATLEQLFIQFARGSESSNHEELVATTPQSVVV